MSKLDTTLMTEALTGTHESLENRIGLHFSSVNSKPNTHLFFIKFGGNSKPNLDDFIEFLYYKIVQFCIPQQKRTQGKKRFLETNDPKYLQELSDQANALFLKATDTGVRSGEPGELILYCILEKFFNAPQLVSKMFLKTSRDMPVHGSDGIHVFLEKDSETLNFVWGESKVYKSVSDAITSATKSIKTLLEETEKPFSRDLEILKDHLSIENEKLKEAVLKRLDCYTEEANKKKYSFAVLVGFNYDLLENCKNEDDQKKFFEEYMKHSNDLMEQFSKKAKTQGIHDYEFMLILIPFESVDIFRKQFFRRLGRDVS
jgi:hypothetical protein